MRRTTVAAVLAACFLASLVAAPAQALVIGIADQKTDMFSDKRFAQLQFRYVRYMVPWDVMEYPDQVTGTAQWLAAAKAAGVTPLISWSVSRDPTRNKILPTTAQYLRDFKKFRKAFPWVKQFSTWNEANHCPEPTCHHEAAAASFYKAAKKACPTCTILASELLDEDGMIPWLKAFTKALGYEPAYWGLHNYIDANRLQTTQTQALIKATKNSQIWLTETGGVVIRRYHSARTNDFPESAAHAAKALSWLFTKLIPLSRRITRVYIYQWNVETDKERWDSALINPLGQERPGYKVVASQQRAALARASMGVRASITLF